MQSPAYQQLAKEFMDLWQKQISAVISDKQFIQAMLEMFQSVQSPGSNEKTSSSASTHTSNAPDADHGVLAEFAFRLAMCEKRISTLEQQHKKSAVKRGSGNKTIRVGKATGSSTGRRSKKPRQ